MTPLEFFTDPIVRAPMLGSILMGLFTSLMGVVAFLKKRSLVGEALSHAVYPGVILGASIFTLMFPNLEEWSFLGVFTGAFAFSFAALKLISLLEGRFRLKSDAALCFVLSAFFGMGLLFASHMQFSLTSLYAKVQVYLYGQAATMTDIHVAIYSGLTCILVVFLFGTFHHLKAVLFDPNFANAVSLKTKIIEKVLLVFFVLAIVIGIRSVGIILLSGMLIAPVVAARQYTEKLSYLFLFASLISMISSFLGMVLSYNLSTYFSLTLPTGPMIVILCCSMAFFSLLFAPKRGFLFRMFRIWSFKKKCQNENILKSIWKEPSKSMSKWQINQKLTIGKRELNRHLLALQKKGWVKKVLDQYQLTFDGEVKATRIVRLHRLWEVYLADHLGMEVEKVHRNAEEMEHIITPELEKKLTKLLEDPSMDPHQQSIPQNIER